MTDSQTCCRLGGSSLQGVPETSSSVMNSMLTAMRSGISAVGRRMGVSLPQTLRKMLEGTLRLLACLPLIVACPLQKLQHHQQHLHEYFAKQDC